MANASILEADSIMVTYGDRSLLSSVYIRCERGKIAGLLGRNGCGKSTLLKVIFGSIEPEYKSVRINGERIPKGFAGSKITLLPQSGLIPPSLSIREALRLFGLTPSILERSFAEAIPFLDQRPGEYSGGELKFLELLMILHSHSEFSLLDEPFSGLSPVMIERAIAVMQEVKERKGLLITDHLHRYVTSCADQLYCISNGRVIRIQDAGQLAFYGYLSHLIPGPSPKGEG